MSYNNRNEIIGADAYCVDGFDAVRVLDSFQETKS